MERKPRTDDHSLMVAGLLRAMWGRDTNLAKFEGQAAAKLSKQIRTGEMPLPDGATPTLEQACEVVASIRRGMSRPCSLAKVPGLWQRHVEHLYGDRRLARVVGERERTVPAAFRELSAEDVFGGQACRS